MNDRLYRSVDDRVLAGVCGGLAVRLGIDPSLVRIGYAVVALLTGVFPLLILYVIMAAVVPEEPTGFAGVSRSPTPPGPDAVPGWTPPGGAAPGPDAVPGWSPPGGAAPGPDAGSATPFGWAAPNQLAADVSAPDVDAGVPAAPGAPVPPGAPSPAWPAEPGWSRRERRERRRGDPLPAVIGGLVLVALGVYFLVRDRLAIDWGIVWAAGLVALGVVVMLAAFRPRR